MSEHDEREWRLKGVGGDVCSCVTSDLSPARLGIGEVEWVVPRGRAEKAEGERDELRTALLQAEEQWRDRTRACKPRGECPVCGGERDHHERCEVGVREARVLEREHEPLLRECVQCGWRSDSGKAPCSHVAGVRVDSEPSEPDRLANDLCGDVVAERDRLRRALERADTLLMAANGALGRAIANRGNPDRTLDDALSHVKARLADVSDTTLTALHTEPSATSEGESRG